MEHKKVMKELREKFPNTQVVTHTETVVGSYDERDETERFMRWLKKVLNGNSK